MRFSASSGNLGFWLLRRTGVAGSAGVDGIFLTAFCEAAAKDRFWPCSAIAVEFSYFIVRTPPAQSIHTLQNSENQSFEEAASGARSTFPLRNDIYAKADREAGGTAP